MELCWGISLSDSRENVERGFPLAGCGGMLLIFASWSALTNTLRVKKIWGEKIAKHKRHLVYQNLRSRITIRKATGRDPTDGEVADEPARIKSNDYTSSLTCKDVIKAFEQGEEVRPP